MFVRVVRFTDVTSSRVKELQARIEEADGPPPDVPATGLQLVFDETHGLLSCCSCSRPRRT